LRGDSGFRAELLAFGKLSIRPVERGALPMRRTTAFLAAAVVILNGSALVAATAPAAPAPIARVEGRVTDSSGEPIAGATVHLVVREGAYPRALRLLENRPRAAAAAATSTADGGFELLVPAAGNYDLLADASGWLPTSEALGPIGSLPLSTPRVVALSLERGRRVSIAAAADQIALEEPSSNRWVLPGSGARAWSARPREVRSDANAVELVVAASGASTWRIGRPGEGTLPATCRVVAGRRCSPVHQPARGVVLDLARDGKPVIGAIAVSGAESFPVGRSDEAGRLTVPVPVGGRSSIVVLAEDGGRAELVVVDPGDASAPAVVKVAVPPPARHAVAVIAAESRAPLPGVAVGTAEGEFAVTPNNGRVELVGARGEGVAAAAAGRLDVGTEIDGFADTTMALVAGATLTVLVVDEAAKPITGAWVRAEPVFRPRPGPIQLPSRLSRRSDASGRVSFGPIDASFDWNLVGGAPGRATGRLAATGLASPTAPPERTLVLARGSVAWARVVDQQGRPIAGADVSLEAAVPSPAAMMSFSGGEAPLRAVSDTDGRARFDRVAVGTHVLEAKAAGFAPTRVPGLTIEVAGTETELGTVELAPEVRIELELVDRDGQPVAGASCWIDEQLGRLLSLRTGGNDREADGLSDRHGRVSIGGQRAGAKLSLLVRAEGFAEASASLDANPEAEPIRVVLEPTSRLGGRVVDEAGVPIAGAKVELDMVRTLGAASFGMPRSDAETADDGTFLFEGLEPGRAGLTASAPGRRTVRNQGIALAAGESQLDHELRLEPGATITGTVRNAEGTPLDGVRVLIPEGNTSPAMIMMVRSGALTNADGHFRLEGAAVGRRLLEAHAPGFRTGKVELELRAGENAADFTLERGASIAGRVLAPAGEPIGGATVRVLAGPGRPSFGLPSAQSDSQGRFRIDGLEPGTISLIAEAEGFAATQSEPIEAAGEVAGIDLVLERGARIVGELRGLSLDQLGRVMVAATRTSSRLMGRADFEGRYTIEGAGPGRWSVVAMIEGRVARGEVEVPAGVDEVQLDLEMVEGATLVGRVVVDGEPGAGLRLTGSRAGAPGFFGATDPAGRFRFEGLAEGTYRVSVTEGFTQLSSRELAVEAPETTVELTVRPANVAGVVVREGDGSPIGGASVSVGTERSRGVPVLTDGNGRFELRRVAAGPSFVLASAEGFAQRRLELELAEGQTETIEIELAAGAGLSLVVAGVAGDSVSVGLLDDSARVIHSGSARIGPEGVVRLDSAPAGEWEGVVWAGWGAPGLFFRATVPGEGPRLTVPQLASVEVTIPEIEGVEVEVAAIDGTGAPARWLVGSEVVRSRKLTAGRLPLVLFEGAWTLQATAPDGRRWSARVLATPGASSTVELGPP
jgi:hypothetical protein